MGFSGKEHEKFIDVVSDCTLELIFKKLPLAKLWFGSKNIYLDSDLKWL